MNRPARLMHGARRGRLVAATAFALVPTAAHAYVDPGSAGFIITSVLGALAAVGYFVRAYWYRLKHRLVPSRQGDGAGGDGSNATARPDESSEDAQG